MQKHGDDLLPISYFSKMLKDSESRYPAIQLELMAIVKGVCAFEYYLRGRHFFILSDSKPLKHFKKVVSPANIISRWLLTLGEYDFSFEHIPGKNNVLADFFSRTPFPDTEDLSNNPQLVNSEQVLPVDIESINTTCTTVRSTQSVSNSVQQILDSLNNLPIDPPFQISDKTVLKEQLLDRNLSKFYNDILNKKETNDTKFFCICPTSKILLFIQDPKSTTEDVSPKIAMPHSLREKALSIAHVPHFGIHKTFKSLSSKYFWKGIYADTVNFVRSCNNCNTSKPHRIPQAPFQNNPIPQHPGDFVSIDLVGPFRNNYHILTIIDRFSRHLQLFPVRTISSQNIIYALFKYISTHGRPSLIHSDLGKQFTAQIFNDFCTKFGIRLTYSTTSHPQTNAISERINQSIKSTIIALESDGYNFFNAVKIHQMMYNSSVHSSTKLSPNFVHFGRELSTLYDTSLPFHPILTTDHNRTYFQLMEDLEKIYLKVYNNLQLAQKIQNQKQQKYAKLRDLNVGDIVYIKSSHTFKPRFTGPFSVIQKCGPVNAIVQRTNSPSSKEFKIHIDRLWISPPRKQYLIPEPSSVVTCDPVCPDVNVTPPVSTLHAPPNLTSNDTTLQNSSVPNVSVSEQTVNPPTNNSNTPVFPVPPIQDGLLNSKNNRKNRKKCITNNFNSFSAQSHYNLRSRGLTL